MVFRETLENIQFLISELEDYISNKLKTSLYNTKDFEIEYNFIQELDEIIQKYYDKLDVIKNE